MDVQVHLTAQGDCYLLCSDGVSDTLGDHEIADLLSSYRAVPERACERLIDLVNIKGGSDNSSVILVKFAESPDVHSGFFTRIFR